MNADTEKLQGLMKQAMRRLAGSVCVISTNTLRGRFAMSATSVTSLTMDPPALLVCVNHAGPFHSALSASSTFAVNILSADQSEISAACGGKLKGEERFGVGKWEDGTSGIPLLKGAQATLVCHKDGQFEYGTHTVFIGRAGEIHIAETAGPLIYVNGGYARAHPLEKLPTP